MEGGGVKKRKTNPNIRKGKIRIEGKRKRGKR
jgi:hypothetical protein